MQISRNEFACKFQGTLQMGQKVIIRFWWESGLSSASKKKEMRPAAAYFVARDVQTARLYVHMIAAPAIDDQTQKNARESE